jgi:hypothetical protein
MPNFEAAIPTEPVCLLTASNQIVLGNHCHQQYPVCTVGGITTRKQNNDSILSLCTESSFIAGRLAVERTTLLLQSE